LKKIVEISEENYDVSVPCTHPELKNIINCPVANLIPGNLNGSIIVIYTISGIKAILQDSSVKFADDEGVSPSSSVITRVSCNML
jgi:hypothetical protein